MFFKCHLFLSKRLLKHDNQSKLDLSYSIVNNNALDTAYSEKKSKQGSDIDKLVHCRYLNKTT